MAIFRMSTHVEFRSRTVEFAAGWSIGWSSARRERRLAEELAGYTTPQELADLGAMLERYPDEETEEIRDILAAQALRRLH